MEVYTKPYVTIPELMSTRSHVNAEITFVWARMVLKASREGFR